MKTQFKPNYLFRAAVDLAEIAVVFERQAHLVHNGSNYAATDEKPGNEPYVRRVATLLRVPPQDQSAASYRLVITGAPQPEADKVIAAVTRAVQYVSRRANKLDCVISSNQTDCSD